MKFLQVGGAAGCYPSLPVRGAWVEIFAPNAPVKPPTGRSPCGERGLKSPLDTSPPSSSASLPVRGAWVEICCYYITVRPGCRRSPCGERGLKSWRWGQKRHNIFVAPRAGSVG